MRKKKNCLMAMAVICLLSVGLSGCGRAGGEAPEAWKASQAGKDGTSGAEPGASAQAGKTQEVSTEPSEAATPTPIATPTPVPTSVPTPTSDTSYDFTLCFGGDFNLDEDSGTTKLMDTSENGIFDCISPEFVEIMQAADVMCLNNEFTYSTRGEKLAGKLYHFRADPERAKVLGQLGVDAVTLANNHVFDYGKEAMLDTLETLEEAEIRYFGAGENLKEAMAPVYFEADGKTVAFVGASRAEKNKKTPQATESEPGILRCYDTELFAEAIREAKANADFCIAVVHWGTEYSYELEQEQLDTGKLYLDAGADAIIGGHSHCLQGLEYYNGKPIVYSLGNYWFNGKTLDTMLVQLHFSGDAGEEKLEVRIVPGVQMGYRAVYAEEAGEQRRIYDFLESISVNVEITDEGIVREAD